MKLCKMTRRRFYHDKSSHMHDINLRKWWDGIKLLSDLSNPLPLTSITVNGTVLKDIDLAEAINESFRCTKSHLQVSYINCNEF